MRLDCIVLALFLTFCSNLKAQDDFLDRFTLTEVNKEVLLNWTIKKGKTCNGIDITRSYDSLNFDYIGQIDGICGDLGEPASYTFIDKKPLKNVRNFYRLVFGGVQTSEIVSIYLIDYGSAGYSIRPNPFLYESKLYFDNPSGMLHKLTLYNINGRKTQEQLGGRAFFVLNKNHISNGMYLFTLENMETGFSLKGKFLIGGE